MSLLPLKRTTIWKRLFSFSLKYARINCYTHQVQCVHDFVFAITIHRLFIIKLWNCHHGNPQLFSVDKTTYNHENQWCFCFLAHKQLRFTRWISDRPFIEKLYFHFITYFRAGFILINIRAIFPFRGGFHITRLYNEKASPKWNKTTITRCDVKHHLNMLMSFDIVVQRIISISWSNIHRYCLCTTWIFLVALASFVMLKINIERCNHCVP